MNEFDCTFVPEGSPLESRIEAFLRDRHSDAVMGVRRMGRPELVDRVISVASAIGMDVCRAPVPDGLRPELIVFDHWQDMDEDTVRSEFPDADVVFGQDLCHQVPAVVRLRGPE